MPTWSSPAGALRIGPAVRADAVVGILWCAVCRCVRAQARRACAGWACVPLRSDRPSDAQPATLVAQLALRTARWLAATARKRAGARARAPHDAAAARKVQRRKTYASSCGVDQHPLPRSNLQAVRSKSNVDRWPKTRKCTGLLEREVSGHESLESSVNTNPCRETSKRPAVHAIALGKAEVACTVHDIPAAFKAKRPDVLCGVQI